MDAFEVGSGEYEDYQTLATFEAAADAADYADWWNLANLDDIARGSKTPAMVTGSTIPHYPAGQWRRPSSADVVDGEVVDGEVIAGRRQLAASPD